MPLKVLRLIPDTGCDLKGLAGIERVFVYIYRLNYQLGSEHRVHDQYQVDNVHDLVVVDIRGMCAESAEMDPNGP